ncbi:MAG: S46 family peptidase [Myxococcales bacterium]|nr:S46 family peptidase [Myxococcales bacterium]
MRAALCTLLPRASLVTALALACVSACATTGDGASPSTPPPATADGAQGGAQAATGGFENQGGMWMPQQLASHVDELKKAGFALDPAVLTDPTAFPLGAVVSLGGCSASFVSPEGLIITNHHCVTGYLQHNSTPQANLLEKGYLARTRADERSGGPTKRVYVTRAFTRVTDRVLGGLDNVAGGERYKAISDRRKEIVGECERAHENTRCQVASFYEGAEYYQIEQLEIRDVRLVYAPDAGIGVFGGEIDNWRWPRHTGDYSFLRAYVGPDGKPADYSEKNVPFQPQHHLRVAQEPTRAGDFVMVAGYPGRTSRLKTAAEVQEAASWYYPRQIAMYEEYIATLEAASQGRPEIGIKAAGRLRGLNNYLTNFKGMLDGLVKGKLADERVKIEGELQAWIDADAQRKAKYGDVLAAMAKLDAEEATTRDRDMAHGEVIRASALLRTAQRILKMADERGKPDEKRAPGYQKRDLGDLEQEMIAMQSSFDPELDRAVLRLFLTRAARLPEADRPAVLATIVDAKTIDDAAIDKALDRLYKGTKLGDPKVRVKLLKGASAASLKSSKDPFIRLAIALQPEVDAYDKRQEERAGAMAALRPRYIAALREKNGDIAPDANSTLRVTFGTVRGYRPRPEAPIYRPFTTLSEMLAKHTGEEPFNAPPELLEAARARKVGPYVDEVLGEVPVNYLADLDITGGNSGSATLNARGELVGLVFDGNYEAMASDWLFIPEITRSIHVDIRYILWIMDAVDGAEHLMQEMGVTPAID